MVRCGIRTGGAVVTVIALIAALVLSSALAITAAHDPDLFTPTEGD